MCGGGLDAFPGFNYIKIKIINKKIIIILCQSTLQFSILQKGLKKSVLSKCITLPAVACI